MGSTTLTNEIQEDGKRKVKVCIVCDCGINICGNSLDNAKENLKIHEKSLLHKKQMIGHNIIIKKSKEGGKKV